MSLADGNSAKQHFGVGRLCLSKVVNAMRRFNPTNSNTVWALLLSQLVLACGSVPAPVRKTTSASGPASASGATASGPSQGVAGASGTTPAGTSSPAPSGASLAPPSAVPTGPGSFTLSAAAAVSVTAGAQNALTVSVSRTAPFSGAVALRVTGLPAGVTVADASLAAGAASATLTFQASETATLGTASVSINGTSSTLSASASVSLTVVEAPVTAPLIERLSGTLSVRQGFGTATFNIHGRNLSGATVTVADGGSTLTPSLAAVSASELQVSVPVVHGATIADYDITVSNESGFASYNSGFRVSAITVRPPDNASGSGNDSGAGDTSDPFRTVGRALAVASSGDKIFVQAGTIAAPAESFPLHISDGVTIQGGISFGVLWGGGVYTYPSVTVDGGGVASAGFTANGLNTTIDSFFFENFDYGLYVTGTNVLVSNVRVNNSGAGIFVGVNAHATLEDSVFAYNAVGVRTAIASVTARRLTVDYNTATGWEARNTLVYVEDSSISYNGSSVAPNNDGFYASENTRVEFNRSQLLGNRTAAIVLADTAQLTNMVATTIRCGYWGIYLLGDAGAFVDPAAGSHIYLSTGMGYALNDARTGAGDSVLEFYGLMFYRPNSTTGFREGGTWQGPTWSNIADSEIPPTWRVENSGHWVYFE